MSLAYCLRWLLIGLLLLPGTALAGDPGENGPAGVVLAYVSALLRLDGEVAADLACESQPSDQPGRPDFAAALDRMAALDYTVDPSGLTAEIVQSGEDWALVRVTGDIVVQVAGLDEPHLLAPAALDLDSFWAVQAADRWTVCAQLPQGVIERLGPDEAARMFLNAAFSGDYALARDLVCVDRQSAFSEAQYEVVFGEMIAQHTVIDLRDAIFDISAQTSLAATVIIAGEARLNWDTHPVPLAVDAAQISGSPIQLVYETGWKVCSP